MAYASHWPLGKNLWKASNPKTFTPSCTNDTCSTNQGDWILDPFSGSSTTGIAANLCGRRFAGLEQEEGFCKLSKARREEIENLNNQNILIEHIDDLHFLESSDMVREMPYGDEIPFH